MPLMREAAEKGIPLYSVFVNLSLLFGGGALLGPAMRPILKILVSKNIILGGGADSPHASPLSKGEVLRPARRRRCLATGTLTDCFHLED